jgi:ATP-dependent RNA helicase DHX57
MPPKRGIVKSGNAGNSSKSSPLPNKVDNDGKDGKDPDEKKHLFPIGSKYPMSLLYERCTSCPTVSLH